MSTDVQDIRKEIEELKTAQATQAATQAGGMATQSAMQAGTVGTVGAGAAGLIIGMFLGIALARSNSRYYR
jgi:hypothetical protein